MPKIKVKEYPALFNADMVRAIISGRKTVTRRIASPQPKGGFIHYGELQETENGFGFDDDEDFFRSPYGTPGSIIYVRESIKRRRYGGLWGLGAGFPEYSVEYLADEGSMFRRKLFFQWIDAQDKFKERNVPSIHAFKAESRIWLEKTSGGVRRLQDMTEADAIAEGIVAITKDGNLFKYGIPEVDGLPGGYGGNCRCYWRNFQPTAVEAFKKLWNSIHGPESWDLNPWVWVTDFKLLSIDGNPNK